MEDEIDCQIQEDIKYSSFKYIFNEKTQKYIKSKQTIKYDCGDKGAKVDCGYKSIKLCSRCSKRVDRAKKNKYISDGVKIGYF